MIDFMKLYKVLRSPILYVAGLLLFTSVSNAQVYYYNSGPLLYSLSINQCACNSTLIGTLIDVSTGAVLSPPDIAICPNGKLYITAFSTLYEVDPATGSSTPVFSGLPAGDAIAMACSNTGLLYGVNINGELIEMDIGTNTATNLGSTGFFPSGDMVLYNGNLYMSSPSGLVQIDIMNPGNSFLLYPGTASASFGLSIFNENCNTLLASNNSDLYLLNLDDGSEAYFCTLSGLVWGMTSVIEFQPPPPCKVTIDLDKDDSSGAFGSDFNAPDYTCLSDPIPIADDDAFILTYTSINQMTIHIASGNLNGPSEYLILPGANNINVSGSGTGTITLTDAGNASIDDFLNALKSIVYVNDGIPLIGGLRQVEVSYVTNNGDQSNTAIANIQVIELPQVPVDLGPDIKICAGDIAILSPTTTGTSYQWSTGETTPTIQVLFPGIYSVTVKME